MSYCTIDDVEKAAGGPDRLTQLSDLERTGRRSDTVLTDAIEMAEGLVNSYAEARYHVPFSGTAPPIIRSITADEVVYSLKSRKGMLTDDERKSHDERVLWLEGLAAGKVSPGEDPRPASSTHAKRRGFLSRGDEDDEDLALTKTNLRGVW